MVPRGSVVNFPGNPRFHPKVAFKMAASTDEMLERRWMLENHTLLVNEEGPLGLGSTEELKEIIFQQFGICKHESYVYRSYPHPFFIIFAERHARDVVFASGGAIDEPVELRFSTWELDEFGDRVNLPYHVRLSIEGIPQHAWSHEIADRVLCDEAIIHHVEENTRRNLDQCMYQCWAFSKDPSKIPQTMFLTLTMKELEVGCVGQVHFTRPKGMKKAHVFKVLIHLDVVEDLLFYHYPREVHFTRPKGMKKVHVFKVLIHLDVVEDLLFYHYPREELIEAGKIPWREFKWHPGRPDSEAMMRSWSRQPGSAIQAWSADGILEMMKTVTLVITKGQELAVSSNACLTGWKGGARVRIVHLKVIAVAGTVGSPPEVDRELTQTSHHPLLIIAPH
jgi:hypothetical protein